MKYIALLLSAAIYEIVTAFYIRAVADGNLATAMIATFILPFLGLYSWSKFIDEKTVIGRCEQTLAGASGMVAGVWIVLRVL
jgi:hypothetical protein